MPTIRPLSDLRNHTHDLARICHESGEPLYVTKHGEGDLVLMSLAAYERLAARLELYDLLEEAERDVEEGDEGVDIATLRTQLGL